MPVAPDPHDRVIETQTVVDESRRSLDNQRSDLNNLRQRGSGLLGVSSVALALATAVGGGSLERPWAFIAIGAFGIAVLCVGLVLWPWTFTFEMNAIAMDAIRSTTQDTPHFLRSVGHAHAGYRLSNVAKLKWMNRAYAAAIAALGIQVLALGLSAVIR